MCILKIILFAPKKASVAEKSAGLKNFRTMAYKSNVLEQLKFRLSFLLSGIIGILESVSMVVWQNMPISLMDPCF
jgi:hypothetical protein